MTNTLAPAPSEDVAPSKAGKAAKAWRAYRNGPNPAVPEDEFLKAHLPLVRSVIERIKALHPYQTPEIVAQSFSAGFAPYLDWIGAETGG